MKIIAITLLLGVQLQVFSQDNSDSRFDITLENLRSALDTFKYTKSDYEIMRSECITDSSFNVRLENKISQGDTNAIKLKYLLNSSYEDRFKNANFTDDEIKGMIFGFFVSRRIIRKFKQLDDSLKTQKR